MDEPASKKPPSLLERWWLILHYRAYAVRKRARDHLSRRKGAYATLVFFGLLITSVAIIPAIRENFIWYFDQYGISGIQNLFLTLGATLAGAAAITFSLVMFAMQVNVERMPHGLFRRLSSDAKLLSSFSASFILAIAVSCLSLTPSVDWVFEAIVFASWSTVAILLLFLYGYRRALSLINPNAQLQILVKAARSDLKIWSRRADRSSRLFEVASDQEENPLASTHDMARTTFFQANKYWTDGASRSIRHAISFSRRYAEQGDHEVAGAALTAVVQIQVAYIEAKGKTFFAAGLFDNGRLSTDGFINETLEFLKQNSRISVTRGDEQQVEQTLRALTALATAYAAINYSRPSAPLSHAHLALAYLSDAVKLALPVRMVDIVMEGARLIGRVGHTFLERGDTTFVVTPVQRLAELAYVGTASSEYQPVTQIAMGQLASISLAVLLNASSNTHYALGEVRKNVLFVAKQFLQAVEDGPMLGIHSSTLGPYYGVVSSDSLVSKFLALASEVNAAEGQSERVGEISRNVLEWSDQLYAEYKELLLIAIRRRSAFTFDAVNGIVRLTIALLFFAHGAEVPEYAKEKLVNNAQWLASVLSWIPDEPDSADFAENYSVTEGFFEMAKVAYDFNRFEFAGDMKKMMLDWAFKAGCHRNTHTFELAMCGIAALDVSVGLKIEPFLTTLQDRLSKIALPSRDERNAIAESLRETADELYQRGHFSSMIDHAMRRCDANQMRDALLQIATVLEK